MSEQKTEQKTNDQVSFAIKLSDPTFFIEAVNAISEIVEEATFSIDQDGLYFRGMDASHVALIDLISANQDWEKWEITKNGNFGVRLDEFCKILKSLRKKESLSLSTETGSILKIKTPSMEMNLRIIECSSVDTPLPKISYNSLFSITGNELDRIMKQISNVSEYITFVTMNQLVEFSGRGDAGDVKITLEKGDPYLVEIDNRESSKAVYSLEYLQAFIKHTKTHTMTLEYSEKMPMRIETKLSHNTKIHFYLAPRVED